MHYKNGRPANNGDKVVLVGGWPTKHPTAGILYNATAGNNHCNGMLAPFGGGQHVCPNLADCYHLDDFMAALPEEIPNTLPNLPEPAATEAATS